MFIFMYLTLLALFVSFFSFLGGSKIFSTHPKKLPTFLCLCKKQGLVDLGGKFFNWAKGQFFHSFYNFTRK